MKPCARGRGGRPGKAEGAGPAFRGRPITGFPKQRAEQNLVPPSALPARCPALSDLENLGPFHDFPSPSPPPLGPTGPVPPPSSLARSHLPHIQDYVAFPKQAVLFHAPCFCTRSLLSRTCCLPPVLVDLAASCLFWKIQLQPPLRESFPDPAPTPGAPASLPRVLVRSSCPCVRRCPLTLPVSPLACGRRRAVSLAHRCVPAQCPRVVDPRVDADWGAIWFLPGRIGTLEGGIIGSAAPALPCLPGWERSVVGWGQSRAGRTPGTRAGEGQGRVARVLPQWAGLALGWDSCVGGEWGCGKRGLVTS